MADRARSRSVFAAGAAQIAMATAGVPTRSRAAEKAAEKAAAPQRKNVTQLMNTAPQKLSEEEQNRRAKVRRRRRRRLRREKPALGAAIWCPHVAQDTTCVHSCSTYAHRPRAALASKFLRYAGPIVLSACCPFDLVCICPPYSLTRSLPVAPQILCSGAMPRPAPPLQLVASIETLKSVAEAGQKWQGERSFQQFKKDAKLDDEDKVRAPTGILARVVERVDAAATTTPYSSGTTGANEPDSAAGLGGGGLSPASSSSSTLGPPGRHLVGTTAVGYAAAVAAANDTAVSSSSSGGGGGGSAANAFASAGGMAHVAKLVKRKGQEAVAKVAAVPFGTDSAMGFGRAGGLGEEYVPSQPGQIK